MKKHLVFLTIFLLCLSTCVFAFGEKTEHIIWMAAVVPDSGDHYLMYSDFEASGRISPDFPDGTAWLLCAIGYKPGAYFILEKKHSRTSTLLDIMYYDGEALTPCVESMWLENCVYYVAYLDDFLYYVKWEPSFDDKKGSNEYYVMRTKKGILPETIAKIPDSTSAPVISARGDLLYFDVNDAIGYSRIVHVSSFGEEVIAEGEHALWLDLDNILFVDNDDVFCCYNITKRESQVFLDVTGRPIQMPTIYGNITINKAKDTVAYFAEKPDEEIPEEYRNFAQRKAYTVSLITGEHHPIEGADFIGDNSLMTWWGE